MPQRLRSAAGRYVDEGARVVGAMHRRLDAIAGFLLALGLSTSALSWWQYATASGNLGCAPGGGCDAVRGSAFAALGPVPTPALGVAFFGLLAALRLGTSRPTLVRALAVVGGVLALGLVAVQAWVVQAWCPWCLVVDATAIALVPVVVAAPTPTQGAPARRRVGLATALGLAAPLGAAALVASPPPPAVIETPTADRVTIETFVDVQCRYCREQHARLHEVVAEFADRVEVVTRHLPLPMHPDARTAARIAGCAQEQGLGEPVLTALMSSEHLSSDACVERALACGADPASLQACLDSSRPDDRLGEDESRARAVGIRRLPTCIVAGRPLEGLQDAQALRDAIGRALADADPGRATDVS
jgi:protein-disulfide isomerase